MKQVNTAVPVQNLIKGVQKYGELWIKYDEISKSAYDAAKNTLKLFECCVKADIEGTSLGEIVPAIKSKLIVKLLKNIQPSVTVLRKHLDGMRLCQNRIMLCAQSFEIALGGGSLYSCAEGSSLAPAPTYIYETVVSLADNMIQVVTHREVVLCGIEKCMCTAEANGERFGLELNWNVNTLVTEKLDDILAWGQFKIV